MFFNIQFVQNI